MFRQVTASWPPAREAAEATEGITNLLYHPGHARANPARCEELVTGISRTVPWHPRPDSSWPCRFTRPATIRDRGRAFDDLCGKYPRYSAADRNFFYAAESWEKAGAVEQARTGWTSFLKYFPHSELAPAALFRLASIRFNEGQYHLAVQDFNKVLAMAAEDEIHAAALYNLAMSHRILGNQDAALAALQQYRRRRNPRRRAPEWPWPAPWVRSTRKWAICARPPRQYRQAVDLGADPAEAVELNYLAGMLPEGGRRFPGRPGGLRPVHRLAGQDQQFPAVGPGPDRRSAGTATATSTAPWPPTAT